ncbi:MAG: iron-containing alcohol dehydrogenase [Collinsella sp.]
MGEKLAAAGAKRVLVHFGGGSAVASGLIERVGASLDAAGIEHLELGGVRPNPEITLVREGVRLCKETNVDWVLAGWRFGHRLREGHRQRCLRGRRRVGALRNQRPRPRCAAHCRGAHHPGRR